MTVLLKVDHGDEEGRDDDQDHRGKGQTYPASNVADIENIEVHKVTAKIGRGCEVQIVTG